MNTESKGLSRRTLMKGVAWSVPVITFAAAAPAFAASGCQPEPVTVSPAGGATVTAITAGGVTIGQQFVITSQTAGGQAMYYRVTVKTAGSPDTVFQNPASEPDAPHDAFNMTIGNSGINGGRVNDGSGDSVFSSFSPNDINTLVLNQRGMESGGSGGDEQDAVYASPSQAVTFTFEQSISQGGPWTVFNPDTAEIRVFDISSATDATSNRDTYWDAVGFSTAPTSIVIPTTAQAGFPVVSAADAPGTGAGTTADPYHRTSSNAYTGAFPTPGVQLTYYEDDFLFNSGFPSGSTMTYSSHDNRGGWQFISILAVTFTTTTAC